MSATMRIPTEFTAIDKFTSVVNKMTAGVSNFSNASASAIDRFNSKANKVAGNMAIAGGAILAPMGAAVNRAIEFEDKMADVAKTTELNTDESEKYGKAILDMSKKTRTSISQLQDIGVVAGTIGVAKNELEAFTRAGNEFAIALGSDFGSTEEAVTQVAKLKNLFKETRDIDIAKSMTLAGSAINEVANMAGSADNINEFMLRMGQLPDVMKPTIQQAAALGGFFEDAGLSAEIASGGFTNLMLVAGKNMTGFAAQMGMSVKSANELYKTDPTGFAVKFSKSMAKMQPRELAMTLDQLKVGSQESIKVVGALGSGYEKLEKVTSKSNEAFAKGESITEEAKKKNDTLAGKLAMAKNNMEALSITIGTQLAPILSKIVENITPILDRFGKWINANSTIINTIAKIGIGLLFLSGVIKAVTIITASYKNVMLAYNFVAGIMAFVTNASSVALKQQTGYIFAQKVATMGATAAQWLWNAAMTANPIGIIIVAIGALIALIAVIITKWDSWGASLTLFLGPIGLIIGAFKSFYDHWESIKKAFQTDGILGGLKRIGAVLLDAVLKPLQQLFEMIGLDSMTEKLKGFRASMDLVTPGEKQKLDSPEAKQARATASASVNGSVDVRVKAQKGTKADTVSKNSGGIPVRVTSTQGAF